MDGIRNSACEEVKVIGSTTIWGNISYSCNPKYHPPILSQCSYEVIDMNGFNTYSISAYHTSKNSYHKSQYSFYLFHHKYTLTSIYGFWLNIINDYIPSSI